MIEYESENEGTSQFKDGWLLTLDSETAATFFSGLEAYAQMLRRDLQKYRPFPTMNSQTGLKQIRYDVQIERETPSLQANSDRIREGRRKDTNALEDQMFLHSELGKVLSLMFLMVDACGNDPREY